MTMKKINLTLFAVAILATFLAHNTQATTLAGKLEPNMVQLKGDKLAQVDSPGLASKKYLAFYYSAHWCPPCRKFTPELVSFYDSMKSKHGDKFEMIFVSSDQSEKKMAEYMEWGKMNWPALAFNKKDLVKSYSAQGIPYLVVLDQEGKQVLGKPTGEDWVYPGTLLPDFKKLLEQ